MRPFPKASHVFVFLCLAAGAAIGGEAASTPRRSPGITEPDGSRYEVNPKKGELAALLAEALQLGERCELVFVGDSITSGWRSRRGLWAEKFGRWTPWNYGVASDMIQHALYRLSRPELRALKPRAVVVMLGANNMNVKPEAMASGIKAVIERIGAAWPEAHIVLTGLLPNNRNPALIEPANALIAELADAKKVHFLDLPRHFTPEGESWKGLGPDQLHLSPEGYGMWAAALEPLLVRLIGAPAAAE